MSKRENKNQYNVEFRKQQFQKDKYIFPQVSDVKVKHNYAFSINPKIQSESIIMTYLDFQNVLLKRLQTFGLVFKIRPEFSRKRRLHYHGYIYFPTYAEVANFYYLTMPEIMPMCSFSIVDIEDTIDDPYFYWYTYSIKDRHLNKPFFKKLNLPYKITQHTQLLARDSHSSKLLL